MNYLNLRHLHAFTSAVECGSMVKAAEVLHLGQPALSQAIAKLEGLAGFRLFDRTTRSLSLTPAGKVFYDDARNVLEQHQRLTTRMRQWAQAQQGSVCLMSIPSVAQFLLPATVRQFRATHPEVTIDVHDLPDPQLARQIKAGQGDIAVQTRGYEDSECATLALLNDPLRWIGPQGHALSNRKNIGPRDLVNETLVLLRKGSVFREMVEPLLQEHLASARIVEVDQLSTLLSMISSGIGVSLLPALCCPPPGALVHSAWQDGKVSRTIVLTRPAGRALMPVPREFMRFMISQIEQGLLDLPPGVRRLTHRPAELKAFLGET